MKGDVIFCKKHPFIITEDGYIGHDTTGAKENIFQAPDSEFEVLQDKVNTQKSERNRSFIWQNASSLTGNCKTSKRQIVPHKIFKDTHGPTSSYAMQQVSG